MYYSTRMLFATIELTDYDEEGPHYGLCIHARGLPAGDGRQYRLGIHGQLTQPDITPGSLWTRQVSATVTVLATESVLLDTVEAAASAGRVSPEYAGDAWFTPIEIRLQAKGVRSPLMGTVSAGTVHWGMDQHDVEAAVAQLRSDAGVEQRWDNVDSASRLLQQARSLVVANSYADTDLHRAVRARSSTGRR